MGSRPDIDYSSYPFPEAKDKWAPGYIFMTRLLTTFQVLVDIRNNNRNRWTTGHWTFSGRNREGLNPVKSRGHTFPILGARQTLADVEEDFTGSKRQRMRVSLGLLPPICLLRQSSILTEVCACTQWAGHEAG